MKKAKQHTPVQWWQSPFLGNPDRAIDAATREFLSQHPVYNIGDMLAYLTQRVPTIRVQLARTHSHYKGSAAPA
jgi:hypothetical protein